MNYSEQILDNIQNGQLDNLEELINKAINHDSKDYLLSLCDQLFNLGFLTEVKTIITNLKENDNDLEYNLVLAEIAIEDGQLDTALDLLAEIPQDSPYYLESLMIGADIYQVLDLPEVSLHKLQEAQSLATDEDKQIIDFAIAELYYAIGDYQSASSLYKNLITNNQNISDISIYERLGVSLSSLGEFEEALPYLQEALQEKTTDDRLFYLGYTYYQLDENNNSIKYLTELLEQNPNYSSAYYYLAESYYHEQQLDEALETINKGLQIDTFQSKLYTLGAEILYKKNNILEAENYLIKAIENEQGETAKQALANLYVTENRFEDAIKIIKQMQEIDGMANWTLAQCYYNLDNYDKALKLYQEANTELNNDPEFLRDFGLFLREYGQIDESKKVLQQYLTYQSDDLEISELLDELDFNY